MKKVLTYSIIILIEIGIILVSYFIDFRIVGKVAVFLTSNTAFLLILTILAESYYINTLIQKYSYGLCIGIGLLCTVFICVILLINPHYDSIIEKYNPQQVIRLKNEIILIGKTTSINSNKLKDYTLDNPKFCKETYFNAVNRKITSDYYICE